MSLTLEELKNKLATVYDEVSLLEILNINSFDIVAAFSDRIEYRFEKLEKEIEEDDIGNSTLQDDIR